ncbi:unnamed protein product [Cuscuta campestris]|uniref:CCHC-type domain-containing protein n=1 Tax=Cuscuta campestris TaxID=132261 RepID=A0A484NDX6_9ASTE|nr:unnamed protein product [Cuscuta campestris]
MDDLFDIRELANEAENLKRPFTEDSLVLKVLRALPESYAMDAKAIRQAHDIKNMTLDQLMGNLETIELQMNEEINQKNSVKQIAFHSHNTEEEDDDEDPSDGDYQEQLSLITKQFKKQWMQKKGRTNYQAESSKGFQFRNPRPKESRAPADDSKRRGPQCFECGGFGHIQSECANNLKKKRQAFVSTWSDEEDDSEEVLGKSNCAFTTQTQNEEPDVLTNRLVMLQEELNSLRKKLDETMQQLEQVEGEKANLNYELTQLKSYQKWMKSASAEHIEDLVDKSRFYGDRTGIGHTLPESSKTPLDLFVTRPKIAAEELKEYNRDKKEAVQSTHIHGGVTRLTHVYSVSPLFAVPVRHLSARESEQPQQPPRYSAAIITVDASDFRPTFPPRPSVARGRPGKPGESCSGEFTPIQV